MGSQGPGNSGETAVARAVDSSGMLPSPYTIDGERFVDSPLLKEVHLTSRIINVEMA